MVMPLGSHGVYMQSKYFQNDLIEIWKDIFNCSRCELPSDYRPQYRPIGSNYQSDGVLFAQINPGHIGRLTQIEIEQRYKRESSKQQALHKQKVAADLISLQNTFSKNPSIENWDRINSAYNKALKEVWGWPPGKYSNTIDKHGISIDEVALTNLIQCPVPKDKYTKRYFSNCWELHTKKIIGTLKPRIIVAQGKTSFNFLQKQDLDTKVTLIEGNHHASRQSNETKNRIFNEVKSFVGQSEAEHNR